MNINKNLNKLKSKTKMSTKMKDWEIRFKKLVSKHKMGGFGDEDWFTVEVKAFIRSELAKQKHDYEILADTIMETKNKEIAKAYKEGRKEAIGEINKGIRDEAHKSNLKVGTTAFGYYYEICSFLHSLEKKK